MKSINPNLTALLAAGLTLLTSATAGAATVLAGGTETQTAGTLSADFNLGYRFTSTVNQSLTALGLWDSSSDGFGAQTYQVGIWTSAGALLGSATISSSSALDTSLTVEGGQWRYETLGTTVPLTAGFTYALSFNTGSSGVNAADTLNINYPTLTTAGTVTIPNTNWFLSGATFEFPTNNGGAGELFHGMVNAQLVPEPSAALLGALGSLLLLRRRR